MISLTSLKINYVTGESVTSDDFFDITKNHPNSVTSLKPDESVTSGLHGYETGRVWFDK